MKRPFIKQGIAIATAMINEGYDNERFANALSLKSQSNVSDWTSGRRRMPSTHWTLASSILKINVGKLYGYIKRSPVTARSKPIVKLPAVVVAARPAKTATKLTLAQRVARLEAQMAEVGLGEV